MSLKVKDILTEMRGRLSLTGYPIISGRMIDVQSDPMPCAAIKFSENGIQSDEDGRSDTAFAISRQTLYLTIIGCVKIEVISEALEELEDLEKELREALFTIRDRNLGERARAAIMLDSRQSYVPDEHSDIGIVEMNISIPYVETYGS